MKLHLTAAAVALVALATSGCQSVQEQAAPNTLVAAKVASAPALDPADAA